MIGKVALGTVQFGLNYGINNIQGKVSTTEVKKILEICRCFGIDTLDTAHSYGNSEEILGENNLYDLNIISKLPLCNLNTAASIFEESLERLNLRKVYGYMFHNFSIYKKNKKLWTVLECLKQEGKISKIGVSLYKPDELKELMKDGVKLDIVQVPYNLFDRQFESFFPFLKDKGIEIHTRSAFLQGLFFRPLRDLPIHFEKIRTKLEFLQSFIKINKLSLPQVCLGFVLSNPNIDKVIIGVDSSRQLLENISQIKNLPNIVWSQLDILKETNPAIINPSLWKY